MTPVTVHPSPSTRPPQVSSRTADRLAASVYVAVAVIALVGQASAAVHWLGWPLVYALPAVAGVELTAIALAARADYRRRKGEAAVAARLLSGTVAAFMTAVNFVGHWTIGQQVAAWFFAGATALGYLVWLLNSADRRRDQMLAEGKVRVAAPDYGVWQWLRRPRVTARARQLALRHPDLGLYGSLDAATDELRRDQRNRALSRALRRRVRRRVDADTADIAVLTYDMDDIAARVAAGADLDGLAALVAADLTPERLAAASAPSVIDGQVVEEGPSTKGASSRRVDAPRSAGVDAEVLPFRARRRPAGRRSGSAATPTVQELADTLCREHCTPGHPRADIGKPTALITLKRVYGSCSGDRAREAKEVHNARHARQTSTGQVDGDDDLEVDAA